MRKMMIDGGKRQVAKMAWPLAVGMLSYTLMGVVDTLLMGHVGTVAQAGVGLATTLFFFFLSFFAGLTTGPQSLVAAADGAKNKKRISMSASAGIVIGLFSGILATALLWMAYEPLLNWIVPNKEIIASTKSYLDMRVFGMPFAILGFGVMAGIQGLGDMKTRMWVSIAANAVNIGLDLILIFGAGPIPAMGEAGAGIATATASIIGALLYCVRYIKLIGWPVLPDSETVLSSIKVGMPTAIMHLIEVCAFMMMNLILARIGAVHLAASEIVINIISLSFLPGYGIGEAGGVLVGRYLGADSREKAARSIASARTLALWIMGACGLLFALRGEWIASFFTQDPDVARLAGTLMIYAAFFQAFDAVATVHLCALRGAGDTRYTMWLTTASSWGVFIPVMLAGTLLFDLGATGAFLGFTLELLALAAVSSYRVRGIESGSVGRLDLLLGTGD